MWVATSQEEMVDMRRRNQHTLINIMGRPGVSNRALMGRPGEGNRAAMDPPGVGNRALMFADGYYTFLICV